MNRIPRAAALVLAAGLPVLAWAQSTSDAPPPEPGQEMLDRLVTQPPGGGAQPLRLEIPGAVIDARTAGVVRGAGGLPAIGDVHITIGQPSQQRSAPPASSFGQDPREVVILGLAAILVIYGAISLAIQHGKAKLDSAAKAAPSEPAQTNFPIVREIGRGGMGVVYEARDRSLDRRVAIKKLREELRGAGETWDLFLKEARTVAALHHPSIVDIHSIVEQGGEVYLVFEYVEGQTVEEWIKKNGRMTLPQAKSIIGHVCQALEFAHSNQVIHRDLKPSNVMITKQGFVKVMDFGIARTVKDWLAKAPGAAHHYAMTDHVTGTPAYMPPEAELGVVSPQSDLYSLGVMLYEMLAGATPFPPPASAEQKVTRNYVRLSAAVPGLPPAVSALIDDALEPEPSKRLRTAKEFWDRLALAS